MRPLQVSLVLAVVATSLAGILSNPLFTLANDSILRTPLLQPTVGTTALSKADQSGVETFAVD
ncbi:MAG: hypothetical protein AAFW84_36315, partial [Cyanobacteria bacterium J06635_15]